MFAPIPPGTYSPRRREERALAEESAPLDGKRWGEWIRAGSERWDVVIRSWSVFARNTEELIRLLNVPTMDFAVALQLMGDDREATKPFWEELDQRLHNQVASIASLVDQTRRLLDYYRADASDVLAEYEVRNTVTRAMPEGAFLRKLRNYLLHYGVAPILQELSLNMGGVVTAGTTGVTGHTIKLSAQRLLEYDGWCAASRSYLQSYGERDGPLIGRDVTAHWTAMRGHLAL